MGWSSQRACNALSLVPSPPCVWSVRNTCIVGGVLLKGEMERGDVLRGGITDASTHMHSMGGDALRGA